KYETDEFEAMMQRIIGDAAQLYFAPICINIHPQNYVLFSDEYSDIILKIARQYHLKTWNIDRWHNFWRARDSWKSTSIQWRNQTLVLELQGEAAEGLALHIPSHFQNWQLEKLYVDDLQQEFTIRQRGNAWYVPIAIENDITEVV